MPGPKVRRRPNFIFIMSDDHAAHALSCYGSKIAKTPNLDRLAREGAMFTNCFVTNSLCAPSRATILTGKYAHAHGVLTNAHSLDPKTVTFPQLLQRAGYLTAIVGKWHLKIQPKGFHYWCVLPGQGRYFNPEFVEMGKRKVYKGYVTEVITDLCIEFLKRTKGRPFCLLCHHKAVHRPWRPPPKYARLFEGVEIPYPETFDDDYKNRASAAAHADMRIADMPDYKSEMPKGLSPEERKKWNYQRFIKDYLRTLKSLDENVGRLLEALDKLGLAENTVVFYTSDNGFFLGDHGWFDKRFMYEESIRVPLLVRYPEEVRPGTKIPHIVLNVDFAPTILDYAGLPIPKDVQGRSIRPLLRGQSPKNWRTAMYYHYYEYPGPHWVLPHYGIRTERYKLIHYYTTGEWELFDLKRDPHEMRNVYHDPAYADVVRKLKAELEGLRRKLGDVPEKARPELVLRYTFDRVRGRVVVDESGKGCNGKLVGKSEVVEGPFGKALRLDGEGHVAVDKYRPLDPSMKPVAVEVFVKPECGDCAILARGGQAHGYALYLHDGVPHFAVRVFGTLRIVKAKSKVVGRWARIAGQIRGFPTTIRIFVNGKLEGEEKVPYFIAADPLEPMQIGADEGDPVGDYPKGFPKFRGLIGEVKVWSGEVRLRGRER